MRICLCAALVGAGVVSSILLAVRLVATPVLLERIRCGGDRGGVMPLRTVGI